MNDRHHNASDFNRSQDETGGGAPDRYEPPRDEWLSAYLDGECTSDESADAEARIAASSELRQLVEDLRNVRSSMETLPQHRLDADFAERVLRRAEREVLTGDGTSQQVPSQAAGAKHLRDSQDRPDLPGRHSKESQTQPTGSAGGIAVPPTMVHPLGHRERFGGSRPLLWTIAALAAAVLILVTNRDAHIRHDGYAQGPAAAGQTAGNGAVEVSDRVQKFEVADELRTAENSTATPDGSPTNVRSRVARPADASAAKAKSNRSDRGGSRPETAIEAKKLNADSLAPARTESAEDVRLQPHGLEATEFKETEGEKDGATEPAPPINPEGQVRVRRADDGATRPVVPSLTAGSTTPQPGERPAGIVEAQPAQGPSADTALGEAPTEPSANEAGRRNAIEGLAGAPIEVPPLSANDISSANVADGFALTAPQEQLRVVQVHVERDAWQRREVENVFARNSIAVFDMDESRQPSPPPQNGRAARDKDANAIDDNAVAAGAKEEATTLALAKSRPRLVRWS